MAASDPTSRASTRAPRTFRARPARAVALLAIVTLVATGCVAQLQPLSTTEALERLNIATTKLYAADGSVLADLHGEINREIIPLSQIPQHLQDAVIAIEDQRFWDHFGVDGRSIGRALVANIRAAADQGQRIQGGSTLSQQLIKNIYFAEPDRTLERKVAEARVTFQFENQYSKEEILEMYLNTIYLGRGLYGIQTAAQSYFHKDASELTLPESAFLAGIIHEPARYDWADRTSLDERAERKQTAMNRRSTVLHRMHALEMISAAEQESAAAHDIEILPRGDAEWRHPYFVDAVLRQLGVLSTAGGVQLDPRFDFLGETRQERAQNVYRGGLRIHTTLDPKVQQAAEEAVENVLPADLEKLSAALAAVEPSTGYVRALVGGRDYYPECDEEAPVSEQPVACRVGKLNLALGQLGGGSGRQPGSSFKIFALAAALQSGIPLSAQFNGSPFTATYAGQSWRVTNYAGSGGGSMNLTQATVASVNAAYARLTIDGLGEGDALKGAAMVAETARRLGIDLPTESELRAVCGERFNMTGGCTPADSSPAITLGSKEVSPLEMAAAYATFANDGMYVRPTSIVKITDGQGRVLYEAQTERERALAQGVALGVTHVLRQVIDRGTGTRASLSRPAAGKTGTSQQWRDAWFAGYVPQLSAAVWVGNPISEPRLESMTPANGYPFRVTGGSFPAMIWSYFMTKALSGVPVEEFGTPPSEILHARPSPAPTPSGELAPVPDVVGMAPGEATSMLASAGFGASQTPCLAPGFPEGIVVRQTPPAGAEARTGTGVTICISRSELSDDGDPNRPPTPRPPAAPGDPGWGDDGQSEGQQATVPNVVGESHARAHGTLAQAGFETASVRECDPNGNADAGIVWSQSPSGGTSSRRGSTVTIWYSPAGC